MVILGMYFEGRTDRTSYRWDVGRESVGIGLQGGTALKDDS